MATPGKNASKFRVFLKRIRKLRNKALKILNAIGASVNPDLVEDCQCISSKGSPKKVVLKLNHRK